jgi:hypothetical protein
MVSKPSNRTHLRTHSFPWTRQTFFNQRTEVARKASFTGATINWSCQTKRYVGHLQSTMDLSSKDRSLSCQLSAALVPEPQPEVALPSDTVPCKSVSGATTVCPIPPDGHTSLQHLTTMARMMIWTLAKVHIITLPIPANTYDARIKPTCAGSMPTIRRDTKHATIF